MHTATRPSADADGTARNHTTALGAPARKPLYLTTPHPAGIDASGDALVLRRDGCAPQRFPLARIERIICNRNANWTGAALALCLNEELVQLFGLVAKLAGEKVVLVPQEPIDQFVDSFKTGIFFGQGDFLVRILTLFSRDTL